MSKTIVGWGLQGRVAGILLAACCLGYSAWYQAPVNDEFGHFYAGLRYWQYGDTETFKVNPPLLRSLATLPAYLAGMECGEPEDVAERTIVAGVLLTIVGSVSVAPYWLAAFNWPAGGKRTGFKCLFNDGSDWGQDTYRICDWINEHQSEVPIYVRSSFSGHDEIRSVGAVKFQDFSASVEGLFRPCWLVVSKSDYVINPTLNRQLLSQGENSKRLLLACNCLLDLFREGNPVTIASLDLFDQEFIRFSGLGYCLYRQPVVVNWFS